MPPRPVNGHRASGSAVGSGFPALRLRLRAPGVAVPRGSVRLAACCESQATLTLLDETFDGSTQFQISSEFFSDTANGFFGILNADGITGLFSGGPGDVSSALPGTEPFMVSSSFQISGFDNAYLVAQDLDGDGGPKEVTVTWENLDISGCAPDSLRFAGKFATDDALNGEFDFDAADFVRILASLDAGSDTLVLEWSINGSGASFNKQPRLTDDTNTSLTSTAQEVQRSIPGTWDVLQRVFV